VQSLLPCSDFRSEESYKIEANRLKAILYQSAQMRWLSTLRLAKCGIKTLSARSSFSTSGRGAALLKNLTAAKGSFKASETIVTPSGSASDGEGVLTAACGDVEEDVTEMEDMFVSTTVGLEWGGKRPPLAHLRSVVCSDGLFTFRHRSYARRAIQRAY